MQGNVITKESLEKQKLQLEISELQKPWYKKVSNIFSFLTFFLAIGTLLWSFGSGLLNVQMQTVSLEKKMLEKDIKDFTLTRDTLVKKNKDLRDSLINMRDSYKNAEIVLLKNYSLHDKKTLDSLLKQDKPNQLSNYYKKQLDSLTNLLIKQKSISKALTSENGQFLLTEDGKKILTDN